MATIDIGTSKFPRNIRRFPRLATITDPEKLGTLLTQADRLIGRSKQLSQQRREVRLELGRVFLSIKETLEHGQWEAFYHQHFAERFTLRAAQKYMRLAAGRENKYEPRSLFPDAQDAEAIARREANARAGEKARKDALYALHLHLRPEDRDGMDRLRRSASWPACEQRIIAFLRQLLSAPQGSAWTH